MEVSTFVPQASADLEEGPVPVFESEEARLWFSWRAEGSRDARDRLFALHGKWAFARAGRYARLRGFDPGEVLGGVAEALLDSIGRFDPAKGVRFPAFASPRVSGALCDAGRENLGQRSRHAPLGILENGDETAPASCAGRLRRAADPLTAVEERETRELLLDAMPDERAREIARRRFWLGESVDEIGLAMGLGKSVVANCLSQEVLPAARRFFRRMGLAPRARRARTTRRR